MSTSLTRFFLFAPLAFGCYISGEDRAKAYDRDGDGFIEADTLGGQDCDDSDPEIYPGAPENCLDSIDSDCDGLSCPLREERIPELWATAPGSTSAPAGTNALADFDGDGVPELVLSDPQAQDGAGMIHRLDLPLTAGTSFADAASGRMIGLRDEEAGLGAWNIGDIDGDGDPDLAVSTLEDMGRTIIVDSLPARDSAFEDVDDLIVCDSAQTYGEGSLLVRPEYGSARGVGDWNGDGRDDFAIGSGGNSGDGSGAGAVFLFTRPIQGEVDADNEATVRIVGPHDGAYLGDSLGAPGDLDADGRVDLIIGAPGFTQRPDPDVSETTGGVFIFTETSDGTVSADDADFTIAGRYANSRLSSCDALGDIDADGYDDIACYVGAGGGQVAIWRGPLAEGVHAPDDADTRLIGDAGETIPKDFGAEAISHDVDADGRMDVLFDAEGEGLGDNAPIEAGSTYLYYGPLTGVLSADHAAIRWAGSSDFGGQGLSHVGDLDQDGTLDFLFDARPGGGGPGMSSAGELLVDWNPDFLDAP